jgi:hypothetical protein
MRAGAASATGPVSGMSQDARRSQVIVRSDPGYVNGLLGFFGPAGWWTQWYYPDGVHGKVHNLFHGYGWRVM